MNKRIENAISIGLEKSTDDVASLVKREMLGDTRSRAEIILDTLHRYDLEIVPMWKVKNDVDPMTNNTYDIEHVESQYLEDDRV